MSLSSADLMSVGPARTTAPSVDDSLDPDRTDAPSVEPLWTDEGCRDLWASVILKALEDLEWCLHWLQYSYGGPRKGRKDDKLRKDRQALAWYWDCIELFFHPDSPLPVMCEWIELERRPVVSKARQMLKDNPLTAQVRRAMSRKPIWERPIREALTVKWAAGRQKYGDLDPDEPFVGDPLLELYEELLDGINYCRQVGTRTARAWGSQLRTIAEGVRQTLKERDRA